MIGQSKLISRKGSKVILLTKDNELWLTHRIKRKKDYGRQKRTSRSVLHIPIKRIPKYGDWLFTCRMEPVQFGEWKIKNPNDYSCNKEDYSEDEWYRMWNEEDFITIDGSSHSRSNCSLHLISTRYAEFFIEHKLWELFEINNQDFNLYKSAVKKVCEAYKIKFEGI